MSDERDEQTPETLHHARAQYGLPHRDPTQERCGERSNKTGAAVISDTAAERLTAWCDDRESNGLEPWADLRALLSERAALRAQNASLREAAKVLGEALQDIATIRPPNGWKAGDIARAALSGSTE